MLKKGLIFSLIIGILVWFMLSRSNDFSLTLEQKIDFSKDIKPIINTHCISCHGGVKMNAGYSLLFHEDALGSTQSGVPAIVPGDAKNSPLIQRLSDSDSELRMPYKKEPLSDQEIDKLSKWIDQGAQWGTHWAYIPPEDITIPDNNSSDSLSYFLKTPIDYFILEEMNKLSLTPNEDADRRTLARRLSFDLTGLPPDENLFNLYTSNKINYESYVDSLLGKTSFGEKWASWWLDLARYADSKGYETDRGRTMWKYRDWVIDALNHDMPFDQFTIEQLAGDLLTNPSQQQLIATAFHRNTMNNDEGGTSDEEYRTAAILDRVNTTFAAWQSTTMECVQCHSHPYDPIRHKEYYQTMSFFNNTRDEDIPDEEPNLRTYIGENASKLDEVLDWLDHYASYKESKIFVDFLSFREPKHYLHNCEIIQNSAMSNHWLALWNNGSALYKNITVKSGSKLYFNYQSPDKTLLTIKKNTSKGEILGEIQLKKSNSQSWLTGNVSSLNIINEDDSVFDIYFEAKNNSLKPQENACLISWFAFLPQLPGKGIEGYEKINDLFLELLNADVDQTPIMVENTNEMRRVTNIFERGNWLDRGDTVISKPPEFLNRWNSSWPRNRLGFAKWLVSKENPLIGRTLVNRIWYQIFGRGIVTTLDDMGTQSEPPTHPKLLDWLSYNFVNYQHWSLKSLIKSIIMSGTYQQSSELSDKKLSLDPDNTFYARGPKLRLSAEEIRDQALFVSQLLSDKMYGPGVMPPQPDGVWEHVYLGNQWKVSKGVDRYRRSIYTFIKRTSPYPSLMTFNAGSREVCMVQRTATNTPLQALVTMNDPVFLEASLHLGELYFMEEEITKSIEKMFEKTIYQKIELSTLEVLNNLYSEALDEYSQNPKLLKDFFGEKRKITKELAAFSVVANAIMNLDQFLTHA
tara:strand:+ start:32 stop:2776 length:2745 start_codon:yes stop_codon:yes gene_type:complete